MRPEDGHLALAGGDWLRRPPEAPVVVHNRFSDRERSSLISMGWWAPDGPCTNRQVSCSGWEAVGAVRFSRFPDPGG